MVDSIDVQALNGPKFQAALAGLAEDLRSGLRAQVEAMAKTTVAEAQARAPRRSGRLAGAHRVGGATGTNRVAMVVDTPYAPVQHWGWPAHGIARRLWLVGTWRGSAAVQQGFADSIQGVIDRRAGQT
jgi:hypothetical protein